MKKPLLRFFYPQTQKEQSGTILSNYRKSLCRGIFSTIIAILLLSFSANAAVYTVSNLNDSGAGSLRQAIISANASAGADIIVFSQSLSGTINSNSLISITDDLTINGNGLITISGQNTTAIFEISDNSATVKNITIRGLTITNGKGGADGGTAPVDYTVTALYGGISCRESLTLDNVTISNCGGGLSFGTKTTAAGQPNLTVTNSTISGITSKAAFSEGQASGGTSYTGVIFVNNCVFDSNTAGVVFTGGTSITIENSSFTNNVTASYGGGIYINNQNSTSLSSVLIQNVTVTGNTAGSGAGSAVALFNVPASAPVTINNCTIYKNSGNSTNYGTELGYYGVINLTVNNSIIYGGTGSDYGAGASTGNTYTATFNNCVLGVLSNSGNGGTTNYNAATLKNTDPLLAATAAFNGGPVKTLALNSNSPAINLGNATGAPTTDARGFARDGAGGKVDAGAYERAASTFSFTGTTIPPNNTTNAASDGNLALIFGSVVAKGSGTIRVYSAPSTLLNTINVSGSGVSIAGNRVNITAGGLPGNTVIYVQADAGAFTANSDGSTATSNAISGTSTFTFTTGTGTAASPSISESGTLAALSTTTGTASSNTSFTVSGTNMTAGITVTAPTGFEVSTSASSGFASSITVGAAGTITSTTVYVRLAAADAPNTYFGNVVLSSSGATSTNVATASSTVSAASAAISSSGTLSALTNTYGTASTSGSFSVSGTNMAAGILVTPPTGYQVSTDNSTFTNTVTVGSPGTIAATTVYIRIAANTAAGTISAGNVVLSSSGATSVNVSQPQSTVNKASLTVTANNQTKAYGAALPTFTVGYSGFVNGDTQASLSSQPTLSTTATAASPVSGSPYAIAPSGAADANYTISYVAAILSVTPVSLTITADNKTKVYGAALPTLTASYAGLVNGDTQASLSTPPTLSTTATATSPVAGSPYAINASGAVDANYTISYASGSLSVTAAPLTITADNKTKVYGAALPTLTASYAGLVNGDTQASLTTPPTLSTTATAASSVAGSPYTINASGAVDANYTISYVAGSLAVTQALLTITADDKSKVAGQPNPTLTASYNGFVNGDNAASLTTPPTLSTAATTGSTAGNYAITPSGAVDNNYTISYVAGNLAVGAASPAIASTGTLNGLTSTYGTASTSGSFSISGSNMSAGILVTPPIGYQVSTDNSTFTNTVTVGSSGTIAATTVYIRIPSNIAAGSIAAGNVVLSSSGATSVNVSQPQSTVNKASLTITASNQTKAYGAALPTLTVGYSGFVNGDTQASLTTPPTLSTTATAASSVAGSPYTIAPSGAADANYTISYVSGSLSVTTAPLTITADNKTKVYGAALPTLTASYAGLVNGDTQASLSTPPTLSTTATSASSVAGSPYTINASGAVDANYTISYASGSLSVTTAPLTITADNKTKVYGAALPTLTASYAGLVNGDTQASLTTPPTLSTTATAASSVAGSPYAINASGAVDANYTISYASGSLSVTQASLTITADNKTKAYGAALPTLTASYAGFVNGDTDASLTTQPTLSTTATATSSVAGSPYTINASGAADPNYTISYVAGSLAVTQASLTITADNKTKAYGAALPTLTASYAGFVNGDTDASLTTQPTLSTTATATSSVAGSPYTINASGAVDANYTISYVAGSLSVTQASLTITADNKTKAYGAALPTLTASYAGFVNGDTDASLTTQPTLSTTATATSSVAGSPYTINASGAVDANYTISYVAGSLAVTQASLTITADNKTKAYGAALPTLTASYAGFVNGDTGASLTTQPTLSTTATATSSVAGSPYTINASGAADPNYTISYVAGSLAVTQASLTITADNKTKAYGAALPTLTASYAGFVNGDTDASLTTQPTLSTTATATSSVAGSPYTITASGAADPNYTISYVAGSLSVTQASLTITADNQTKAYGAALPTLTASYAGFVNGDTGASLTTQPTLSTTATATSSVAGSPYTITASGAADPNYTISYVAGSLSVTQASLTITADNKTKAYGAALPTLTASYAGFVNGDTQASLTTQPTLSTTATATSSVAGSPYAITASGAADPNYTISYVAGSLSVTQASLTITADNKTKAYGAAVPTLTASYAGFVNGDTDASLTTQPTLSTTATATSSVAGSPYAITASGAADPNYTISYVAGSLSVTQASLTITADNKTKAYGAAVPTLTASYAGFVNGDTDASLTTQPTLSTTATATSSVAGSPYTITASGAADPNYTISYVAGSLSVTQASLTITADNKTKAYGAALPTLTASYAGFVNGDTGASLTTQPTLSTTATATSSVAGSPYAITASGAADPNYTISYVAGSLSVTQASLTITADNKTKAYGAALPTLTASYAGFVNGDTGASLTTQPTLSTTATATSSVAGSPYTITASGAADPNYTISYVAGSLSVTQASLTITADNQTKAYGAALPTLTASYAGFVNGDTGASLTTQPTLSTTATATSSVAGSPYAITASGAADPNYTISYVAGSLSVTQASLTITADNKTKAYGAALPTLTASYAGFVNGDTGASLTTQPTLSTTATATSSVAGSPYAITASGAADPNYTISYVAGSLSVTQASLTITADNKTKAYGAALPTLTASYAGFVNGDTDASLTTQPTLSTTATATSSVAGSPYAITASGAADPNYSISYVNGTLTVGQAALTVTADNQTKTYGAANPALTVSYAGFVNGDTQASLTTPATATTTATAASAVGNYSIVPSGATDNNYTISYVNGNLTVGQAALTVTADNQTKTYGAANPTLTVSYAGFVNGDTQTSLTTPATATTTATAASAVGNYTIVPSGAADNNYTIIYVNGTLNVGQAALTVTADNQTKTYGAANPALTVSYTGFVNGDTQASLTTPATATTTATTASAVGNYTIVPSGAADNNYTISYVNGALTVGQEAIAIVADPKTKVYGQTDPALTYTITSGALVGSDAFTGTLTRITGENVGAYAINQGSLALSNNYNLTYTGADLAITPAVLTVTANDASRPFGKPNPALSVSYSGFEESDTPANLTVTPVATTSATQASLPGTYPITASGAASANYTFSYVQGTLTVTPIMNSSLAGLSTTAGAISPAFASGTFSYNVSVGNTVTSTTVTPTAADPTETINVAGSTVASGAQSNSIKLKVGNNAIATVVTAQDGSSTTYTINVSRAPSAIASLDDLTLSNGTLAPIFNTNVSAYTTLIDYTVNSITLTPTPTDPTATITVNGEQVTGGSASGAIPLNVGFNTITVVVTAQDGTTQQTYKLVAERGIAPSTITATNILTPNGDGKNDYWVIKDIELYPNNTVTVFDRAGRIVYTKHNYGNTWDGTFNGSPLNEDTYYYLVDLGIGLPKIKGYVTIVRNRR